MNKDITHTPVLVTEVVSSLVIRPGRWYIDATMGLGGHTQAILNQGGNVIGIDQDQTMLKIATERLKSFGDRIKTFHLNFSQLPEIAKSITGIKVWGILFDLGVSSPQIDSPSRGFSFSQDAPLDMRMNPQARITAKDIINQATESELYKVLVTNAQESNARAIASAIINYRHKEEITTTKQLADLVTLVSPKKSSARIHPATKTFQAIRIEVNQELDALKQSLPTAFDLLTSQGRLSVISFHEGEDRIVKQFINKLHLQNKLSLITKKPIIPNQAEVYQNPRSRSAKLRIAEKIS